MKDCLVADGNKHWWKIDKVKANLSTSELGYVLLTASIDAHEDHDVATIDTHNAFVQTRLEHKEYCAVMRLQVRLIELMVKVDPKIYTKYMIIKLKGYTILYMRLLNTLYGIIKASLLYYKKFVKDLKLIIFALITYYPCVSNKIVRGKQLTVVFHVDDIKVSQRKTWVVTNMDEWMKKTSKQLFDDGSGKMTKENRDLSVKDCLVADGNKHWWKIDKVKANLSTSELGYVLLTASIDAHEDHDVATIDTHNAFVQTRLEHKEYCAVMRLQVRLIELMVKVDPKIYTKYMIIKLKGYTILYMRLLNTLYGIIKASLLYYKKFVKDLKLIIFALITYYPCVSNKIVRGKQLTVVFHVDDIKVSQRKTWVVTNMDEWMKKTSKQLFDDGSGKMTLHCGKSHEYLGMTLDYSVIRKVKYQWYPMWRILYPSLPSTTIKSQRWLLHLLWSTFKSGCRFCTLQETKTAVFHNFVTKCLFAKKWAF